MAGIGFELNRILNKRNYTSLFRAYAYAGLVGSGPWLIAVLSLGVLGGALTGVGDAEEMKTFFVTVSVIYSMTLVLTGPIQLVFTRYAADLEFTGNRSKIFPTFILVLSWQGLAFLGIGLFLFFVATPAPPIFAGCAALLMAIVANVWLCGILLGSLKNYRAVLIGFALGFLASVAGAYYATARLGGSGAMLGFTVGHSFMLLFFFGTIFHELGSFEPPTLEFLGAFKKYWDLALGGLFYNLGIWIDKYFFWWADPSAVKISGFLYSSPVFDKVVYFSFLTIIPGMTVFLLKLETEFSEKNQSLFQHILRKGTLNQIHELKNDLVLSLKNSFLLLLKVQGLFTALLIFSAERVLVSLGLTAEQKGVFQIALIGVFLLQLFLAMLTILYYLDKRKDALFCTILFTTINAGVTMLTITAGERWFGFGFLMAAGVALSVATVRVNRHLQGIIYDTFTSQPVYG